MTLRRVRTPSPSNGFDARRAGSVASSTIVTSGEAICWPSDSVRNVERRNNASPLAAPATIRARRAAVIGSNTTGTSRVDTFFAPILRTVRAAARRPTSSGDSLAIAGFGVTGQSFTPNGTGAGQYTFTNRQPVTFTGVESVVFDNVPPTANITSTVGNPTNATSFTVTVIFSDGVTEACNGAHEDFGIERLAGIVSRNQTQSARTVVSEINRAITEYTMGAPQADDTTLIVARRVAG